MKDKFQEEYEEHLGFVKYVIDTTESRNISEIMTKHLEWLETTYKNKHGLK